MVERAHMGNSRTLMTLDTNRKIGARNFIYYEWMAKTYQSRTNPWLFQHDGPAQRDDTIN